MGSSSIDDARKWNRQRIPILDRVKSLILRFQEGGTDPASLKMSEDMFSQLIGYLQGRRQKPFPSKLPKEIKLAIGGKQVLATLDKSLPVGSMRLSKE